METCVKAQALTTVARDVLSMALGMAIGLHEEFSGRPAQWPLLSFAALLLGGPPAYATMQFLRGKPEIPPTPSESSPLHSSSLP